MISDMTVRPVIEPEGGNLRSNDSENPLIQSIFVRYALGMPISGAHSRHLKPYKLSWLSGSNNCKIVQFYAIR